MARTERSAAVVLRSVAYGEADRIVTLLTEAFGKLAVMARGARKSRRRFGAALEPYALIEVEVGLGRGELGRLAQARVVRAFPGILADLSKMSVAAAGLELVREATPERETPDPRLLPTVVRFFELVEASADEAVRLAFTLRLLALLGLRPNLERCGRCGRVAPEGKAALFDPALGTLVCRACGGGPVKLSGALRARMRQAGTRRWDAQAQEAWPEEDRPTAGRALDAFLERHLGRRLAGGAVLTQVREVERATRPSGGDGSQEQEEEA
ncbi:MAG TPA: DNA repair protein RecO [Sandaracinaceae bacterium LLY-WYZ-13_1]|nr:DNA repair protein RecO [Sandaracinaceae bacterium LLY-WYZ-13_1]